MTTDNKPNLAMLIDADNISAKYLPIILNEISRYGVTTYRRIYGDFTDPQAASWRQKLLDNNITPIQQFSNVKSHKKGEKAGKNATDSTLIIDAMDILYAGRVDGFVIVSSDSDFTRLASRLRESNMMVIGMGRNQTAISFRHACTKFVNIELLYNLEQEKHAKPTKAVKAAASGEGGDGEGGDDDEIETTVTLADVESVVAGIIHTDESKGRESTSLAVIGTSLNDKFPDFDVRNFGYTQLYKLIDEIGRFELIKVENGFDVRIKDKADAKDEVAAYMLDVIAKHKGARIAISSLATKVYKQFPSFNLKDFGYSQFYKFANGCEGITVTGDNAQKYAELVEGGAQGGKKGGSGAPSAQGDEHASGDASEPKPSEPSLEGEANGANASTEGVAQPAEAPDAPKKRPSRTPRRRRNGRAGKNAEVYAFIEGELKKRENKTLGLSALSGKVKKQFPEFDLKEAGFDAFYKFIENSKNIQVTGNGRSRKATIGE